MTRAPAACSEHHYNPGLRYFLFTQSAGPQQSGAGIEAPEHGRLCLDCTPPLSIHLSTITEHVNVS
jgi:hypothetical protein